MNYKTFSKTLLEVYNSLDAVCSRIDKMVDSKALAGAVREYSPCKNSLELFNNIINLSQRKVNLINLKLRIEHVFLSLKEKEAKVLILKYVDRLTFSQISNLMGQSLRNVFRICDNGIVNFGKIIKEQGLTDAKIEKDYNNEKWIFQIYEMAENKKVCKKKEDDFEKSFSPRIITRSDISRIASRSCLSL